jgi:hypothetical protein
MAEQIFYSAARYQRCEIDNPMLDQWTRTLEARSVQR